MSTVKIDRDTDRSEALKVIVGRARSGDRVVVKVIDGEAVYVIGAADFALLRAREDAADHALIQSRRDEPTTPYAEFAAELGL